MRIYLVRHGDAVAEDEAGSDRDRWLSARGRDAVRALGTLLHDQGIALDAIICSPLPRAVQTAELLAAALGFTGLIESQRALEPAGQPQRAAQVADNAGSAVLVVSHEPLIAAIAAHISGAPSFPAFRTAQCSAFDNGRPLFTLKAP